ncbi:MAG: creatininase family protein [Ignavibacteriaceae bacterium]|nr:creatininase family protein [Ignavibacteriaceae bacterium]
MKTTANPAGSTALAEGTYKELREQTFTTVILPWGATEPHNYHLPYGTDIFESEYISRNAADYASSLGARIAVLPVIPFGVNTGQLDLPYTININPSTQMMILKDILSSLQPHGVKKFFILNSHGGNDFKQILRELQPQFPGILLGYINWFRMKGQDEFFEEKDDHAGEMETSIMMYIRPELVLPLSEAGEGKARLFALKQLHEGWAWTQREWTKATSDTGVGNPKKASAEKGKRFLEYLIKQAGDFLYQLDATPQEKMYAEEGK